MGDKGSGVLLCTRTSRRTDGNQKAPLPCVERTGVGLRAFPHAQRAGDGSWLLPAFMAAFHVGLLGGSGHPTAPAHVAPPGQAPGCLSVPSALGEIRPHPH